MDFRRIRLKLNTMKNSLPVILICLCPFIGLSQNHTKATQSHENHSGEFKKHRVALEFGYVHVPDAYEEEPGDQSVFIPSIGIEYLYRFNHKWGAALTANMETGNYLIEFNREDLARENVAIIAAVAVFEIMPHWGVFTGPGIEIEKHHNFFVWRVGTDYQVPLGNNWDITPVFSFDHKDAYTSWELMISIGKQF